MITKTIKILKDFNSKMNEKNISSYAASTAFFLFISMIPILCLICTVISYTNLSEEDFISVIMDVSPGIVSSFFISLMEDIYAQSAGAISIAILITIWSAGKGTLALMRGLNVIHDVQENRGYFVTRGISGFYTLIMIISVSITLIFMGFGREIFGVFMKTFPNVEHIFAKVSYFRFLYFWMILTLFFALIYTYVPNKKLKFKMQIPGAVFSAIVWTLFSWGFSIYIYYFGGFGGYGSLTTVVIVLLWLYFMIYIILIGAHINIYFGPVYHYFFKRRIKT